MLTSILGILNGAFSFLDKLMGWWSDKALKDSGVIEERNRANERTLQRAEIAHGVDLEPVPSDKRVILDGM
jgi:hypothetical protein